MPDVMSIRTIEPRTPEQHRRSVILAMLAVVETYADGAEAELRPQVERLTLKMNQLPGQRTAFAGDGEHRAFREVAWDVARLIRNESNFERGARWARALGELLGPLRGLGDVLD